MIEEAFGIGVIDGGETDKEGEEKIGVTEGLLILPIMYEVSPSQLCIV